MKNDSIMKIGEQMYTVRDHCKDLTAFSETLKKIADIGYKYVQVSGTCTYDAEWLKSRLRENGLKCVLTHTPPEALKGDVQKGYKGSRYFGL